MMRETVRSGALYYEAKKLLPGGVSSPPRIYEPYPLFIAKANGATMTDVDGNDYIDYNMAEGALVLGHARPEVSDAVRRQLSIGALYDAPVDKEVEMAKLIHRHVPSMEMMRFVNSGSEAAAYAMNVARAFKGRKKVIRIEGSYHGAHGSVPTNGGVRGDPPINMPSVPYNDLDGMKRALYENKGQVAAVIMEPVITSAGPILPLDGYLQNVREMTERSEVLLIFDEITTGFRLGMGGAQQYFGVRPDMTVLGKIAGGGLPMGIFGASREIMSTMSPVGEADHGGTFNGNPLSLAAGIETIRQLRTEGHSGMDHQSERLRDGLRSLTGEMHRRFLITGIGSMFQMFLTDCEVRDIADARRCDPMIFMRLFNRLLEEGVYLPHSQYKTNFLSTAHSGKVIDRTVDAFSIALSEVL